MKNLIQKHLEFAPPVGETGTGEKLYDCPMCNGRGKLQVHPGKGLWYCHKCGVGGRCGSYRGKFYVQSSKGQWEDKHGHTSAYRKIWDDNSPLFRYLRQRRDMSMTAVLSLQPHTGPSPYRVYLPCFDLGSSIPIYFIGRSILPSEKLRYVYPSRKVFNRGKGSVLWGLHRIHGPVDNLVLCEGAFDAVHYLDALGLLGSSISEKQINIVKQIAPKEITVMLDGDTGAKTARMCHKLVQSWAGPVWVVKLRPNDDPDTIRDPAVIQKRERFG